LSGFAECGSKAELLRFCSSSSEEESQRLTLPTTSSAWIS